MPNDKDSRIIEKQKLALEILETQEHLWKLRARAKRLQINETKRLIAEREGRAARKRVESRHEKVTFTPPARRNLRRVA